MPQQAAYHLHPPALLTLTLLLLVWLLPPGVAHSGAADELTRDCATAATRSGVRAWVPQYPLHRGLHLLPGTPLHDYGSLRPYIVTVGPASPLTITVPARVDLSRFAPPVGDQGAIGSCAAWATTYTLVGWYINKEHLPTGYMAPMYTYHQINAGADQGSWLIEALQADTRGMVPMRLYPQGNYDWHTAPTGTQMALAAHWRAIGLSAVYIKPRQAGHAYHTMPPPSRAELMTTVRFTIERALASGHPGVVEVGVQTNLSSATPPTAWIGPHAAPPSGAPLHALVAVGYDTAGLWVQNAWGTGWGLNGDAELSWDYVLDNVLVVETIDGVRMTPGVRLPPLYRGAPTITATIVKNGQAQPDQTALRAGEEVVWTAKGFHAGETVKLSWDGRYRSYVTALPDGTWSVEWYDHPSTPIGWHNLHPSPGVHRFAAVGERGDRAWTQIIVR